MGKNTVRKAIIPAAGLGTRFLPATKAQAKEMLPIVDKPTLQYIIEEAIESGIEEILIVTGRNKKCIEDHFDRSVELELELENKGKKEMLEMVQKISNMVNIHYIRQKEPKGLGHAVHCAKSFIGDEPFAVLLGDDIVDAETIYCIIGLMIGSMYAVIMGPKLLEIPQDSMSISTFSISFFAIGCTLVPALEKLKDVLKYKNADCEEQIKVEYI